MTSVSVVIACYNQARYLGEAIESVLAQREQVSSEIIVVDDGSTDDTVAVANSFPGVRCISQRNQGQGAARNAGLAHASGEFLVVLDSDDRLLPNAFETGMCVLAEHPECAFTAGRCVVFGPEGVRTDTQYQPLVERDHYRQLLRSNYIWMPATVMFRSEIVQRFGGFRTNVSGAEDYDLYLRIAREHPIWCHDAFVAEYRQHDGNTTRRSVQMMRASLEVMNGQRPFVKNDPESQEAWRRGVRFWQSEYGEEAINLLRRQIRGRQWRDASATISALLLYYPRGVAQHGLRKLSCLLRGRKPEPLDVPG
jgi:glycosyltransferase involved in cell wall biosynthesis